MVVGGGVGGSKGRRDVDSPFGIVLGRGGRGEKELGGSGVGLGGAGASISPKLPRGNGGRGGVQGGRGLEGLG